MSGAGLRLKKQNFENRKFRNQRENNPFPSQFSELLPKFQEIPIF